MKKFLILLLAGMSFWLQSCQPEKNTEEDSGILANAICEMDIQAEKSSAKAVDMVGDSLSVHRLAVYACLIKGSMDSSWIMGADALGDHWFFGDDHNVFIRDTINHVFSYLNDAVIIFEKYDNDRLGVPGTEYLGWLACYVEPVFCALYDTVENQYFNPLRDVDSFGAAYNRCRMDTLGYVPREMMEKNRKRLLQLMSEQRFQDMLDVYKHDYHIYTCTGKEYRDMYK